MVTATTKVGRNALKEKSTRKGLTTQLGEEINQGQEQAVHREPWALHL